MIFLPERLTTSASLGELHLTEKTLLEGLYIPSGPGTPREDVWIALLNLLPPPSDSGWAEDKGRMDGDVISIHSFLIQKDREEGRQT